MVALPNCPICTEWAIGRDRGVNYKCKVSVKFNEMCNYQREFRGNRKVTILCPHKAVSVAGVAGGFSMRHSLTLQDMLQPMFPLPSYPSITCYHHLTTQPCVHILGCERSVHLCTRLMSLAPIIVCTLTIYMRQKNIPSCWLFNYCTWSNATNIVHGWMLGYMDTLCPLWHWQTARLHPITSNKTHAIFNIFIKLCLEFPFRVNAHGTCRH